MTPVAEGDRIRLGDILTTPAGSAWLMLFSAPRGWTMLALSTAAFAAHPPAVVTSFDPGAAAYSAWRYFR